MFSSAFGTPPFPKCFGLFFGHKLLLFVSASSWVLPVPQLYNVKFYLDFNISTIWNWMWIIQWRVNRKRGMHSPWLKGIRKTCPYIKYNNSFLFSSNSPLFEENMLIHYFHVLKNSWQRNFELQISKVQCYKSWKKYFWKLWSKYTLISNEDIGMSLPF